MSNQTQPKILTEEELNSITFPPTTQEEIKKLIASHRSLNSRNHKLVLENDELMSENVFLKKNYNKLLKEINSCQTQ